MEINSTSMMINDINIRCFYAGEGTDTIMLLHGAGVDDQGVVKVRLQGACSGCPMASMTLKNGIERVLKEAIPEVKEVVSL